MIEHLVAASPTPDLVRTRWIERINRPLYRVKSATVRECAGFKANPPWHDIPMCQVANQTIPYTEMYYYDPVGNIEKLIHDSLDSAGGGTIRDYSLRPGTNRLKQIKEGGNAYKYLYDVNGNMMKESSSRHFEWDHSDQMRAFRTRTAGSEPSLHAQYLYDSVGQRVMKLARKQGGDYEMHIYIDDLLSTISGARKEIQPDRIKTM